MPQITPLPRAEYEGYAYPFDYTSGHFWDVRTRQTPGGFSIEVTRTPFETPLTKRGEDRLYDMGGDAPEAFGVLEDGRIIAILEISPALWNNTLRVQSIWVEAGHRQHGLGHALMAHIKDTARAQNRRAVVLEVQSCNDPAIAFYRREGFTFSGIDLFAYTNDDPARREVRLEMVCPL